MIPASVLKWRDLANKYAGIHPILTPNEVLSIIWEESTGDPNAVNPGDPSWGLMQTTMLIAKYYGGITEHLRLFDPDLNVSIGSAFLADLKTKYQSTFPNWVTGYNQGEKNLLAGSKDQAYWDAFNSHLQELNQEETQ
jgi:soluble lytic murein transglycosylase-like protein